MPNLPFELVYDERVYDQLDTIENKYISLTQETIEAQLRFEADVETRNRKPLKEPASIGADWELRFGPNNRFRIFYAVDLAEHRVIILAIGVKIRNELWIGKERWEL